MRNKWFLNKEDKTGMFILKSADQKHVKSITVPGTYRSNILW